MICPPEGTATRGRSEWLEADVFDHEEPDSALTYEFDRDYDDTYEELLVGPSFTVRYDDLGTFIVKLRAIDSTGREGAALATINVLVPLAEPAPEGGCLCSSKRAGDGFFGWVAVATLGS